MKAKKLFSEYKRKFNKEYGDYETRLLISNSRKKADQPARGDLSRVLKVLGLNDNIYYWDLKKAIWGLLGLKNPVQLPKKEQKTIRERSIDNAAEITILLKKEGDILLRSLSLPLNVEKGQVDMSLIGKILSSKSQKNHKVDYKTSGKLRNDSLHKKPNPERFYEIDDYKAIEEYQSDKKYLHTKRNTKIEEDKMNDKNNEEDTILEDIAENKEYDLDEDVIRVDPTKKTIIYESITPDIKTLHANYQEDDLILHPPFQRNYVWNRKKASNLIESILLKIPIPIIYTAEENGKEEVIDGHQRLRSIFAYIDGKFPDEGDFKLANQAAACYSGKSYPTCW